MKQGDNFDFISAKTLIKCMVKVDPAARITAKEIRDHHWVKVCDYPVRLTVSTAQFPNFKMFDVIGYLLSCH